MSEVAAVMVPVAALKAWAGNPRKNDPAVDEVAASIKRFGFGSPIIARQENGEVIAGHTRLKAAIRLKLVSVPVRYMDLSAEEAHAYALADNKLGEISTWDQVPLADAFRDLEKAQVDLLGLGWDGGELEKFLGHKPGGGLVVDPDADPNPAPGPNLADRFGVPPFSVLDARQGYWQERKRAWLAIGIQSELGRGASETGIPGGSRLPPATVGEDGKTQRGDGRGRVANGGGRTTWVAGNRPESTLDDTSRKILRATKTRRRDE